MKRNGFVDEFSYREGHYLDSGLTPEEREQKRVIAEKECQKLTSWEEAIEYDQQNNI